MITFGILTNDNQDAVNEIVLSIEKNNIPNQDFEIIIVGNIQNTDHKVIHDPYVESKNWITRKKNLVVEHSSGDIILILKDYIKFDPHWYTNFMIYDSQNDWDILMNIINDERGHRYLDWIWENPVIGDGRNVNYTVNDHKEMFVPGCFLIAKRYVLQNIPFNERMVGLNRPTDVEWSKRAMQTYKYSLNVLSNCIAFGKKSRRYPKFRRLCLCNVCY